MPGIWLHLSYDTRYFDLTIRLKAWHNLNSLLLIPRSFLEHLKKSFIKNPLHDQYSQGEGERLRGEIRGVLFLE